jgi:hypothetical protein
MKGSLPFMKRAVELLLLDELDTSLPPALKIAIADPARKNQPALA